MATSIYKYNSFRLRYIYAYTGRLHIFGNNKIIKTIKPNSNARIEKNYRRNTLSYSSTFEMKLMPVLCVSMFISHEESPAEWQSANGIQFLVGFVAMINEIRNGVMRILTKRWEEKKNIHQHIRVLALAHNTYVNRSASTILYFVCSIWIWYEWWLYGLYVFFSSYSMDCVWNCHVSNVLNIRWHRVALKFSFYIAV